MVQFLLQMHAVEKDPDVDQVNLFSPDNDRGNHPEHDPA